ncbi:hypothetical protein AKJ09_03409 [Labilithrix luteola]|uniref:Uncharacterized protein n=1 Tax=Labilithrix luteola TaxID=1391654 RepID=A0A0K1PT86_9BACT|nr:hypothetical protein AKJ09_03409 [Labilithrix luteola]
MVKGGFVRTGLGEDARLCMTLDTNHLQDAPGNISSTDGRFKDTPLRSIPQIWHDPLSTLNFGEGRVQNLIYSATPVDGGADVMVVISLMESTGIEVRMLRSAPPPAVPVQVTTDAPVTPSTAPAPAPAPSPTSDPIFGVFTLKRQPGSCD